MSEEKKDDFLSGHEELLSSINKEDDAPEAAEEEAAETSESEATPVPEEEESAEEPAVETAEEVVTEQHLVAEVPPVVKEVPAKKPKPKKKPATPVEEKKQKHDALEQAEVKEVLNFMNKYVKPVAYAVIAICLVFLGTSLLKSSKAKKIAKADAALNAAQTASDYEAVMNNYSGTPSAPLALLALAQEKFKVADAAGAESLYAEFVKKYPDHAMTIQAQFNQIQCKEAMKQYGDAAILYGDFKNKHPDSHLAPMALMGKARCMEETDNYAEAKIIYEDIITFYPGTAWSRIAENNLKVVSAKLK